MSYKKDSDLFEILTILVGILVILSIPTVYYVRTTTLQTVINKECKTNYNLLQVAIAGKDITNLCRVKNQTITIK
jgi:hypothetical protein